MIRFKTDRLEKTVAGKRPQRSPNTAYFRSNQEYHSKISKKSSKKSFQLHQTTVSWCNGTFNFFLSSTLSRKNNFCGNKVQSRFTNQTIEKQLIKTAIPQSIGSLCIVISKLRENSIKYFSKPHTKSNNTE